VRLFKIKLNRIHEEREGPTAYEIAKRLNLNENTVRTYLSGEVTRRMLPVYIKDLADFFGVDWRDSNIVEIIEVADDEAGQEETLLASA